MSNLAMAALYGRPDRNSGRPRSVDLLGQLMVGGSGLWTFHRLDRPQATVRLRSVASVATEVKAGFALSGLVEHLDQDVTHVLGSGWRERDVDVDARTVEQLADLVDDLEVALVLTHLGPALQELDEAEWASSRWSVTLTSVTDDRLVSQWG